MRDPKAIRKAIMTAKSIAAMVDPHFASVPLPDIGQPTRDMEMPPAPQQFAAGGVTAGRSPELQSYAQNIGTPDFDQERYNSLIDQHKPVRPYESVPMPATEEDMLRGLTANKHHKINAVDDYQEGHPVGLRLDIPAYTKHQVWVPTMHDLSQGGKPFSHQGAAHITDATFDMPESQASAVAKGRAKSPFARIDGRLKKTPVDDIHEMAKAALDNPEWVQVGMDPERHSYFYDRSDHRKPIQRADEVLQVGPLVLAKNPVFGDPRDHAYEDGGRVGYADGGMPDNDRQANLDAFLEGNHPLVPSVVYHGTDRNISEFDTEKPRRVDAGMDAEKTDTGWYGKGHYFTPYKNAASHFASGYRVGEGGGPNVMPVHLSLKNPFIVKFPRSSSGGEAMDAAMNAAGFPQTSDERLIRKGKGERLPSEQTKMLMDAGHDGVIVMHQYGIKDPEEERAAEERERAAWERHQAAKNAFYEAPFENASNGAEVKALKDEFVNSRREYHAAKEAAGGEYHPHELVVFRPHQVKSAIGNSGRYDPNEAHIGRATGGEVDQPTDYTAPDNLGLYSHAAATAASLPQAKASPAEFRNMLTNRGVKPVEFEASGYDQAFAPRAGSNRPEPITREQVAAHFNQNRTPIVEKSFREEPPKEEEDAFNATYAQPYYAARDRLTRAIQEGRETGVNQYVDPTEEFRELQRDYEEKGEAFRKNRGLLSNKYGRPHHEDYMLPGGENYREVLLKHGEDGLFEGVNAHFKGEPNVLTHLLMKDRTDTEGRSVLHLDELQSDWAQQGRKRGFRSPAGKAYQDYVNGLTERFIQAAPSYFRDQGYGEAEMAATMGMYRTDPASMASVLGETLRHTALARADADAPKGTIRSAPYVTNTNDWVDLGLKRALTEAAKGGHDKLAWTPGQTAADRYNLSKHIAAIHHEKNEDGTYNLHAIDHSGYRAYAENNVPEEKLEETFGKEIASKIASGEGADRKELQAKYNFAKKEFEEFKDKLVEDHFQERLPYLRQLSPDFLRSEEDVQRMRNILKNKADQDSYTYAHTRGFGDKHMELHENLMDAYDAMQKVPYAPGRDWRSISGLDLQVGGEGMKKFYDDIVPKRLMALAKKHDPEAKFSTSTVKHPVSQHDYDKGDTKTDLHALEITPRMRESILKKGFPAYASGGEVDAPDDEAPIPPRPNPMARSFAAENAPSVTVSPRPGKMGGYPVRAGTMGDAEPWTYATPQGEDQPMPPPVQHPVFNEPRMSNIHEATRKIFKSKGFNDLTEELTGLRNFNVKPIIGTWKGEIEPSFHISHPDMTPDAAEKLSHLLGFGFMQDAAVKGMHNPNPESEGIPSVYMGHNRKLSRQDLDRIHEASRQEGLDFSQTSDGRGVKFMHFGDEGDEFDKFAESAKRIQQKTRLPHIHHVNTSGDLNYAQDYLKGIFGQNEGEAGESGDLSSAPRPSDLFGRVINHIVAPYAKAVAAEGYRLSPDRLRDTYGLSDQEHEQVRKALLPGSKDRTVIPLMEGTESLDIRPTGDRGKATVGDALFALQNRAAAHGQIEPGDFSKEAMEKIAKDIAKEVDYHVNTADKSAIGWYDAALKKAMTAYEGVFPELKNDNEKRMLFHAILGITSQGNDVHSNSVHTARLYNLLRNGEMSMPEGVEKLKGTFGDKTRAIEQNLLKFHHLIDANGHDDMRDLFGQKKTVSEWNKILRDRPELHGPDGTPLSMQGGANQKVTGWTVFGPKIGSFINNLSGDYSTLTADLWFSRTWNRLLGHNFIHTPLTEAKQYQDFRDALVAEHAHHNPDQALSEAAAGKTSNGQVTMRNGVPAPWEHGKDVAGMGRDDVDSLINDPDKMLETAKTLAEKYRKGGYKDKSDLRRRAKNWIENRELPVAAPRGNSERDFQQNTVERSQRILKNQYGKDISVADIQAALWFLEKDLFGKMGVASEKAAPADYADAAHNTINLINNGALYNVKSRPNQVEPVAKAYGGVVRKALAVASMPQNSKIRSALMIAKGLKKS